MTELPAPPPRPTSDVFRATMARFVSGVTVVTSLDGNGLPHGMTANAVSSLSLDPLLVLVCVDRRATMASVVATGQVMAISVLAADQEALSARFASPDRGYGLDEFDGVATRAGVTGAPLLEGAAAWLDCRVTDLLEGGDHIIVICEVLLAETGEGIGGLLYTPSGYDVWMPSGH